MMNTNALTVSGLKKKYQEFTLSDISFEVPQGTIVGLIGENGAGKSTIVNTVLGLTHKDGGSVTVLGKPEQEIDFATRNQIGVVFDSNNFPNGLTPRELNKLLKNVFLSWDEDMYFTTLEKISLPTNKKIKTFSKGMKMKLSIAVSISHHAKLLILDEATSGLDPIVRDDILDMLLDFVQDEENSILVSSHITSDLEKIADYIVFIHDGCLVFSKSKDELLESYGIIKCGAAQFDALDKRDIISYRKQDYEWQVLVADRNMARKKYSNTVIVPATIDEIMLLYIKGKQL